MIYEPTWKQWDAVLRAASRGRRDWAEMLKGLAESEALPAAEAHREDIEAVWEFLRLSDGVQILVPRRPKAKPTEPA